MTTKTEAIVHWMDGTTARVPADTAVVVVMAWVAPEFVSVSDGVPSVAPWGRQPTVTTMGEVVGRPCGPRRTMSSYHVPPAIYVNTGNLAAQSEGPPQTVLIYRRIRHSEWPTAPTEQNP